jgi:hypothetical protein
MPLIRRVGFCLFLALIIFPTLTAYSGIPPLIGYQGYLADSSGNPLPDNVYSVYFRIYDAAEEGDTIWASGGYAPIQTKGGYFTHQLGSTNPLPDSLADFVNLWLGVTIGLDSESTPRHQFVSTGYAFKSIKAYHSNLAETSLYTDTAQYANEAMQTHLSDYSIHTVYSDSSGLADSAPYAEIAGHSTMADTAVHSIYADSAVIAEVSNYSDYTEQASDADSAASAVYADSATITTVRGFSAYYADQADLANFLGDTDRIRTNVPPYGLHADAFADTGHTHGLYDSDSFAPFDQTMDEALDEIRALRKAIAKMESRLNELEAKSK